MPRTLRFSCDFKCFLVVVFRQTLCGFGLLSCARAYTDGFMCVCSNNQNRYSKGTYLNKMHDPQDTK
jgi:hypothetical protein